MTISIENFLTDLPQELLAFLHLNRFLKVNAKTRECMSRINDISQKSGYGALVRILKLGLKKCFFTSLSDHRQEFLSCLEDLAALSIKNIETRQLRQNDTLWEELEERIEKFQDEISKLRWLHAYYNDPNQDI